MTILQVSITQTTVYNLDQTITDPKAALAFVLANEATLKPVANTLTPQVRSINLPNLPAATT